MGLYMGLGWHLSSHDGGHIKWDRRHVLTIISQISLHIHSGQSEPLLFIFLDAPGL